MPSNAILAEDIINTLESRERQGGGTNRSTSSKAGSDMLVAALIIGRFTNQLHASGEEIRKLKTAYIVFAIVTAARLVLSKNRFGISHRRPPRRQPSPLPHLPKINQPPHLAHFPSSVCPDLSLLLLSHLAFIIESHVCYVIYSPIGQLEQLARARRGCRRLC